MSEEKYVAYVGTYTHGNSVGIHIFDMDVEEGSMKERIPPDRFGKWEISVFHR